MKNRLIAVFALLLSLMLLLFLSSCGSKPKNEIDDDAPLVRDDDGAGSAPASANNAGVLLPDLASVMAGNGSTDTVWGEQNAATQQEIINSAKADGYDVSFGKDGSMTVKGADGSVVVQNPDGTWTLNSSDGTTAQFGGDWPDNEFTKLLPKPDFQLYGANSSNDGFTAASQSATVAQIKAYAEKVKAKGFTVDAEEDEQNVYGIVIYTYKANNAAGFRVEITFASGTSGISISK